jgi:DNA-directed RNA polymerase specialized sigma24 family protein
MSSAGSVTHWIAQLKAGNHEAAQQLWERYFQRLVGLVRVNLRDAPRRAADAEDVALSAFESFCRGAEQGRFPQLRDRHDLWRLLVTLAARKAFARLRPEGQQERGGAGPDAPAERRGSPEEEVGIDPVIGSEPSPLFAAQVAEEYQHLLDSLQDKELCAVAVWKMEGHTNAEIAARLGCVRRSVERKLSVIRKIWEEGDKP